jgi:hypothetical protein
MLEDWFSDREVYNRSLGIAWKLIRYVDFRPTQIY